MELKPKFEKSGNGLETVTMSRAEFDWLIEQAEDAADLAAAYEGLKSLKEDGAIPAEVARAIRHGKHPIAAARAYRKMTQTDLADAIGMTQAAIARLETSAPGSGRADTIDSIAEALAMPRWLFEPRVDESPEENPGRKVYSASADPVTGRILSTATGKAVRRHGAAAKKSKRA